MSRFLEFIREIDFTSIFKAVVSGVGGTYGWVLSFVLGPIFAGIEAAFDKALKLIISDSEYDAKAKADAQKVEDAKTDEQVDQAVRDSLGDKP